MAMRPMSARPPSTPAPAAEAPAGPGGGAEQSTRGSGPPPVPEPFDRLYSLPEAPRWAGWSPRAQWVRGVEWGRRGGPRPAGALVVAFAVLASTAAAGTVLVLRQGKARQGPASPYEESAGLRGESARVFTRAPGACQVVPAGVLRRPAPAEVPTIESMGGQTAGICTYSFTTGTRHRAVRVESRAFLPRYLGEQATGMTIWSFDEQLRQAERDAGTGGAPHRVAGLGDAAFERSSAGRAGAVGEVTVRYRNVLLRVRYTEERPPAAERAASERRCLTEAISMARAGLTSYR